MLEITQYTFPEVGFTPTAILTEKISTMLPYELSDKGHTKHNHFVQYVDEVYVSKDTLTHILNLKRMLPKDFENELFNLVVERHPSGGSNFQKLRRRLIVKYCINILERIKVDQKIKNLFQI